MVKMIRICYTNASYTSSSFQFYILNIQNVVLFPKQARGSHHWAGKHGKRDLQIYGLHDAIAVHVCICFIYLSKVNSGRKVVHWTRTLSQDSCSLY